MSSVDAREALEILTYALVPFVEKCLALYLGADWLDVLNKERRTIATHTLKREAGVVNWSPDALLNTVEHKWDAFAGKFKRRAPSGHNPDKEDEVTRGWVRELLEFRRRWAHANSYQIDVLERFLSTCEQLLLAASKKEAAHLIFRMRQRVLGLIPDDRRFATREATEEKGHIQNPKPLRFADIQFDDLFLMFGNHSKPFEILVHYEHDEVRYPPDMVGIYRSLIDRTEADAKKWGYRFFDGPCVRLKAIADRSYQSSDGTEQARIELQLGPISWYDFTAMNTYLDEIVFKKTKQKTIRQRYADRDALFSHGTDLRWCELSNLFVTVMMPITTDGLGLIVRRNRRGVSVSGGLLTCGISENMHRYLDEASPSDLHQRVNQIRLGRVDKVSGDYRPNGVPSPFLTVLRGVHEEISPELHRRLRGRFDRIKFLDVVFQLDLFQPYLVGVVEVGMSGGELRKLINEHPPADHTEASSIDFLKLSSSDAQTKRLLSDRAKWDLGGLAAAIAAIRYWEAKKEPSNLEQATPITSA